MSINKVILIGRLGKDPELKQTPTGTQVCNFTLATSEAYKSKDGKQEDKTQWHNVTVFGKQAENCAKYLSKGRNAYIEGRIEYRSWEKEGKKFHATDIIATQVQFLDFCNSKKGEVDPPAPPLSSFISPAPKPVQPQQSFSVDDIPF